MSENNEEYVSMHADALRCETRFCHRCLSHQVFRATAKVTVNYFCESCGAIQTLSENSSGHIPTRAVPARRLATLSRC